MRLGDLLSNTLLTYSSYRKFDFLTTLTEIGYTFPNTLNGVLVRCDQPVLIRLGGATGDQIALTPGEWLVFLGLTVASIYYLAPDWRCQFGRLEVLGVY